MTLRIVVVGFLPKAAMIRQLEAREDPALRRLKLSDEYYR
jgi:hypothetical protein